MMRLNNEFKFKIRPKKLNKKPCIIIYLKLNFRMKLKHKFNVVKMTNITIKKILKKDHLKIILIILLLQ